MGAFQGHLQGDVLSVLLDAGVLFLLRWSLDDTSDGVVAAAIQGFAAILIVPSDKVLDENYSFVPCALENTVNQTTRNLCTFNSITYINLPVMCRTYVALIVLTAVFFMA